ncbi:hypothetical protein SAY86_006505 [Trapa natans]|uniref:Altered inheritance of mitochondria protein 32 n=1 Tax=Trapa natans TaxID=22666 RepID=A0AAN7L3P6_TRANT|nr:hypothetical protein SAY86_006505 [Trapa natans]
MAATENGSPVPDAEEEAVKFGFQRPEMYSSNLANTVDAYDRHVFLCYKCPNDWLPRVEDSEADPLPKVLSAAVKARKNDINLKTKLTICGGCNGTNCSDGDVLIFPDMVKYKGLTELTVDEFVDDVLVNGKQWDSVQPEVLTGSHVFVCAHGSRDKRCGLCGPALIEKLEEEIELRGIKNEIFVSPCSHIGGHKYAGNLIIYSPDAEGKIFGHWYGYVTPDDVPELLDQHISKGQVIERLWRGQMGVSLAEGEKTDEKPSKGKEKKAKKHLKEATVKDDKEKAPTSGCCQGSKGTSCCNDGNSDDTSGPKGTKGLCNLSCWVGKWEQHELLTAAAVVGAVAAAAVAYSFYKRSR